MLYMRPLDGVVFGAVDMLMNGWFYGWSAVIITFMINSEGSFAMSAVVLPVKSFYAGDLLVNSSRLSFF